MCVLCNYCIVKTVSDIFALNFYDYIDKKRIPRNTKHKNPTFLKIQYYLPPNPQTQTPSNK